MQKIYPQAMILMAGISMLLAFSLTACAFQPTNLEGTLPFTVCNAPCRYQPKGRVTLGAVIDFYGFPERIAPFVVPGDEKFQIVAVDLFYPAVGMTVLASKKSETRLDEVARDFEVNEVAFWNARTLRDMAIEFKAVDAPEAYHLENWSQAWTGFGPVKWRSILK